MYRKYIEDLNKWLRKTNRKPLIVWGARQVGKTYLIRDTFAEQNFKGKYIYIDCRVENDFVSYCHDHVNADEVLRYLSISKRTKIGPDTLLIFDEAQECLPIITLMKYFCQDHRDIPVIVTGSMVRMKIKRNARKRGPVEDGSFLFPVGKINQLTVYPLTFDEYLVNSNRELYDAVCDSYRRKQPLDEGLHKLSMDAFYDYVLIGGMPEVVDTYLRTGEFNEAREILEDLYDNYLGDMELYQASPESIVRSRRIFETVYSQLNKVNSNFKSGDVEKGTRSRDLRSPIDWLVTAHLVQRSVQKSGHVTSPLIEDDGAPYRLYLCDMGIFTYQSGINASSFLSNDGRNMLSGIFYENYASIELASRGIGLFFWVGKGSSEFEFIFDIGPGIVPMDVKKNKGKLRSIDRFRDNNGFTYAVKVSSNRYGFDRDSGTLTVPFYQLFLLADDIAAGKDVAPGS